ncbi:MAG: peptide ABC transporter substrate-binding protein [Chloroflexota bacterium]
MHKRLLGILASIAVIVAACGGAVTSTAPSAPAGSSSASQSTSSGAPASGAPAASGDLAAPADQILRLSLGAEDPASLDPSKASTSTDIGVLHALDRGLIYFDKDQKPVPALATEMPKISADLLTYTFTLRDAKYSNNDPIVAGDIVYAWKRLSDPRTGSTYGHSFDVVAGADALFSLPKTATDAQIDAALAKFDVAAPDDHTFVVKLAHPTSYFLDLVALWGADPIQEKWVKTPNFTEAANYVSSGPFMMKSWTHQAELVLVPNPNWYGQKPTIQEVHFKIGGDPAADQASFEAGELDMLAATPGDVPRIKADAKLGPLVVTQPTLITDYWGFGTAKGPTANVHLRRALSMAIDKDTMLATVSGGQGVVAGSPIPPGMPGHQADIGLKFDVAAAKTELAQALTDLGTKDTNGDGKIDAADLGDLSFGFNTNAGHEIPSAYMQNQWRTNLGIHSVLSGETFDQFLVDRPAGKFSLARNAWGADYPHPDNFLRVLFATGSGNNDEQFSDPAYDALLAKAGNEPDFDKSIAIYNQAQELLVQAAPAVFTRWRVSNYEVRPWVTGYLGTGQDSNVIGDLFFETISILKH